MAEVANGTETQEKFHFQQFRDSIKECIATSLCNSVEAIAAGYAAAAGSDSEKKPTVDQAFKDVLKSLVEEEKNTNDFIALIYMAVLAVDQELCSASIPFVMLSEILDTITIDECEKVFEFVEDRVDTWKSDTFYNAGKNYLLRMCNDLLRRLSKSQHTIFCGRIQLFLARLFPLSEKSGLNLMSQFNLENVTEFTNKMEEYDKARRTSEIEKDDAMEEGEMPENTNSITIDYNLYKKFWELQDYFRKPTQCYDKEAWKRFSNYSDEVLACFESFKLDEVKSSKRSREMLKKAAKSQTFFAKYLTSEKLLDLQLSDGHFRRYVLAQFLILFQYLHAQVKFKSSAHILAEDQAGWIKGTYERVFKILRETPPDGKKFADAIEHILSREENWNTWKNEGCPSYVKEKPKETVKIPQRPAKRSLGEDLKASGGKLIKMGSAELTRLWNLCPDNMAACRDEKRNFLPQPEVFFEDATEQADPEAMVEDEYKLTKNSTFAWKSLRLLARRSSHFFAMAPAGQQPGNKQSMSQYLEETLNKLAKERPNDKAENDDEPQVVEEEEKTDVGDDGAEEDKLEEDKESQEAADSPTNQSFTGPEITSKIGEHVILIVSMVSDALESPGTSKNFTSDKAQEEEGLVTKEQCELLADQLGEDWKKLAAEFNFPDDEIEKMQTENHTDSALKMLQLWRENEFEKATVSALRHALKELGLVTIASEVFGEANDG